MRDDWCDTCHKCLSTCHADDEVCSQCGDCFAAAGKTACPDCGLCEDCCEANSKAAGCDHGVCIKSDDWESHWSTEHTGKEHIHVYVWHYNKDWHYKQCLVSGCPDNMTKEEPHRYGDWVVVLEPTTETEGMRSRVCLDCGRCDEESIPCHTHSFGAWQSDADGHWKECGCGERTDAAAHTFVWKIDKEATKTETGLKHEECTVCGLKRNENTEIAKLSSGEDGGTTTPGGDTEKPDDGGTTTPGGDTGNTGAGGSAGSGDAGKTDNGGNAGNTGNNNAASNDTGNAGSSNTGSGNTSTGSNAAISPQTGDSSQLFAWYILLFVSGGTAIGLGIWGKKRRKVEAE